MDITIVTAFTSHYKTLPRQPFITGKLKAPEIDLSLASKTWRPVNKIGSRRKYFRLVSLSEIPKALRSPIRIHNMIIEINVANIWLPLAVAATATGILATAMLWYVQHPFVTLTADLKFLACMPLVHLQYPRTILKVFFPCT